MEQQTARTSRSESSDRRRGLYVDEPTATKLTCRLNGPFAYTRTLHFTSCSRNLIVLQRTLLTNRIGSLLSSCSCVWSSMTRRRFRNQRFETRCPYHQQLSSPHPVQLQIRSNTPTSQTTPVCFVNESSSRSSFCQSTTMLPIYTRLASQ